MKTNQMAVQAAEYEIITLPSGLTVQVRPMPGYSSVHAVYGTDFGSIDRFFYRGRQKSSGARGHGAFSGA